MKIVVPRKVMAADQKNARKMRSYFHTGDAQTFPGTVPGVSLAEFNDLRNTGKVSYTTVDVGVLFGMSVVTGEYPCELARVAGLSPMLAVLVNGRSTELPAIHAKGFCAGESGPQAQEYFVSDDPANPIVLKWNGGKNRTSVLRIEFPVTKESPNSIERFLTRNEVAQLYGIYFSFNRAEIRTESERILKEIAGVLKADGRLSTEGHGESSPQATNETLEGRARNRRVELRRT